MNSLYRGLRITLLFTMLLVFGLKTDRVAAQPGASISFQTFYDELSPYGEWIDDPEYGYVWVPDVDDADFRPYYSSGQWAMTDYGNMWVSDYPWGWAPFHYGRWTYNNYYGWVWVPDTEWGPAWVNWRDGGGYYGWAPLSPGISITASFGNYNAPSDWWVFIPCERLFDPGFRRYYRGPRYNQGIYRQTIVINNTYRDNRRSYIYGPRRNDFEARTGRKPQMYNVRNGRGPQRTVIQSNTVQVYRPEVRGQRDNFRPRNAARAEQAIGRPQSAAQRPARLEQGRNMRPEQRLERPGQVRMEPGRNETQPARPERSRPPVLQEAPQQRIEDRRQQQWNNQQQRGPQIDQRRAEDAQRQQMQQQRGQEMEQRRTQDAQRQQMEQQRQQMQQQRGQEMEQRRAQDAQRQQMEQQRQQMQQQRGQEMEQRRAQDAQRQQMDQQRQQQRDIIRDRPQQREQPQRTEQPRMERSQPQQIQRETPQREAPRNNGFR